MRFLIALFGAPPKARHEIGEQLHKIWGLAGCSLHGLDEILFSIARQCFAIPADRIWDKTKWMDKEDLYYGKTINQLIKGTHTFGRSLDKGIWVDRVVDEVKGMAPTCPYNVWKDGRTEEQWDLLRKKAKMDLVVIGVLFKNNKTVGFPEDDFDLTIELEAAEDCDYEAHAMAIAKWVGEVHGAASSS